MQNFTNLAKKHAALLAYVLGIVVLLVGPQYLGLVEDTNALTQNIILILTALGVGIGEHIEYDRKPPDP